MIVNKTCAWEDTERHGTAGPGISTVEVNLQETRKVVTDDQNKELCTFQTREYVESQFKEAELASHSAACRFRVPKAPRTSGLLAFVSSS